MPCRAARLSGTQTTLIKFFRDYLVGKFAPTPPAAGQKADAPFDCLVTRFARTTDAVLFHLSNGAVQVGALGGAPYQH